MFKDANVRLCVDYLPWSATKTPYIRGLYGGYPSQS